MLRLNVPILEKPARMGFANVEMNQPVRKTQTLLFVIPKKANVFPVSEIVCIYNKSRYINRISLAKTAIHISIQYLLKIVPMVMIVLKVSVQTAAW